MLLDDHPYPEIKTSLYAILDDTGILYGRIKRTLFKDCIRSGKKTTELKNEYLSTYKITARQFNAIRYDLDGNIKAVAEINKLRTMDLEEKIISVKKWIANNESRILKITADVGIPNTEKKNQAKELQYRVDNKKRKRAFLEQKLSKLREDQKNGRVRICFGSNKIFRKQFSLEENGYKNHNEWLLGWRRSRNSTFFCLGSKDESGGNQTCTLKSDGTMRLRVPDCMKDKYGQSIIIPRIKYPYGQEHIETALQAGIAISHRFTRGEKGWYLHTTVDIPKAKKVTYKPKEIGSIGVDVNEKEIAVSETDRYGNYVRSITYPSCVKDLRTEQTEAMYSDICQSIVDRAAKTGKPISHEELDFSKKKASLKEQGVTYARMLSGFAYGTFLTLLDRRAAKHGVSVLPVNPAFTTTIGKFNYVDRYGITSHEAAALAIARRSQHFSERPDSARIAPPVPARNRGVHIWSIWRRLKTRQAGGSISLTGSRRSLQDSSGCAEPQTKFTSTKTAQSMRPPLATIKSVHRRMGSQFKNHGTWVNQRHAP